jgi:predicted RNase H-like nuclease (RuvC/YqgF family)
MPWWTWAALGFFGVVVVTGAVVAFVGFLGMRRLEKTGAELEAALDDLSRKGEKLEARLQHAEERADLVERKLTHLDASLERLSVLTWALGDVAKKISHVRSAVLLRK